MVVLVAFIARPVFFPVLVSAEPSTAENHAQKTTSEAKSQAFADSTGGEDDEFSDPAGGEEDRQEVDPTFLADTRLPAPQLHHAGDESSATTLQTAPDITHSEISYTTEYSYSPPGQKGSNTIKSSHYSMQHTGPTLSGSGRAPAAPFETAGKYALGGLAALAGVAAVGYGAQAACQHFHPTKTATTTMWPGGSAPPPPAHSAPPPPRLRAAAPAPAARAGCC